LAESIDRAIQGFRSLNGVEAELADKLVEEGFLSYDDLSIIEPDELMEMGNLTEEQVTSIVSQAEALAAVTRHAARALGLSGERGMLSPGFAADFALWEIESIEELGYWSGYNPCRGVVRAGELVRGALPKSGGWTRAVSA